MVLFLVVCINEELCVKWFVIVVMVICVVKKNGDGWSLV